MKTLAASVRQHFPEYLIEAWALGMFMISAGVVTWMMESPGSIARSVIANDDVRRALIGIGMGLTGMALIYSPWGKQSGAHMNPAVTLTFLRLGKIKPIDALCYAIAQFIGGALGVMLTIALLGASFTQPPVDYVVTSPGPLGVGVAFIAELIIAFVMMSTVLQFSNRKSLMRYTGVASGVLVATYIAFEAPLSGMSLNPARSFASALPAGQWHDLWIYFLAPPLGMLSAAWCYERVPGAEVLCAKLIHAANVRCIHCGYDPDAPTSCN